MWRLALLLLLQTTVLAQIGPDFSYYHKTDDINNELKELNQSCNGMLNLVLIQAEPEIYAIDIENKQGDSNLKGKAMIIFGEHARELISTETGLHLLRQLCGTEKNPNVDISPILQKNKIRVVLNSNPLSRKLVENGEYCTRVNENKVDINRNWDAHWEKEYVDPNVNPGPEPFSEPETKALKATFEEFKPDLFLAVHSGTLGMYTPYAAFGQDADENGDNMRDILNQLNPKYCDCDTGSAAKALGMPCKGTAMDYAYEHQVSYAFAFEIFTPHKLPPGWSEPTSLLQVNQKTKKLRGRDTKILLQQQQPSCFFEASATTTSKSQEPYMTPETCFTIFNPTTEEQYKFVVNNWTTAILELLQLVNQKNGL